VISAEDMRALELYRLALSLVEAKGHFRTMGLMPFKEYRAAELSIVLMPKSGQLDVWHGHKVLTIRREDDMPLVMHYAPGEWEKEIEAAAKLPPKIA
jgi:hypothetical protein